MAYPIIKQAENISALVLSEPLENENEARAKAKWEKARQTKKSSEQTRQIALRKQKSPLLRQLKQRSR